MELHVPNTTQVYTVFSLHKSIIKLIHKAYYILSFSSFFLFLFTSIKALLLEIEIIKK
jgi:hypothetical protein